MAPGDRLICAFTEPVEVGREFKEWLLHVTIVPWFRIDVATDDIAAALEDGLRDVVPFKAVMGPEEQFSKPVNLVANPISFEQIAPRVREYLHRQHAWITDETTKRKWPFRPHVTVQKSGRLQEGDSFVCDRLYIVKQLGKHKVVEAAIMLGK
jgi:hypothetical protein